MTEISYEEFMFLLEDEVDIPTPDAPVAPVAPVAGPNIGPATPEVCGTCGVWVDPDAVNPDHDSVECDRCLVARFEGDRAKFWGRYDDLMVRSRDWSGCDWCCGPGTYLSAVSDDIHRLTAMGIVAPRAEWKPA